MEIKELRLNHFGKFHNKTITLHSGINLIYGENEAGKSTIHSFIKGMLFGIEKQRGRASKDDTYLKYQPWDAPSAYSGSMDIEAEGKLYRILRNFDKNSKSCTVIDIQTGRELNLKPEEFIELYGGLTESGYRNTISMEQLRAKTDQELVEEVRNYLANLSLSKSNEVDVTRARNLLQEKRKELEGLQLDCKIHEIKEELEICLQKEGKIDELTLQLKEVEQQLKLRSSKNDSPNHHAEAMNLEKKGFDTIALYEKHLDYYPVIKEKYHSYYQDRSLLQSLKEKLTRLKDEQTNILDHTKENSHISEQLKELENMNQNISQYEQKQFLFTKEYGNKAKEGGSGNRYVGAIPVIVCIFSILLYLLNKNPLMLTIAVISALGFIGYFYIVKQSKVKQNHMKEEYNGLEEKLTKLKDKKQSILLKNHVTSEQELKSRYEYNLKAEMSLEHLKNQIVDYEEQIESIDNKIQKTKKEILDYVLSFSFLYTKAELQDYEIKESSFLLLEEYIRNEKQSIAKIKDNRVKEYEELNLKKERVKWELKGLEDNEDNMIEFTKQLQELEEQEKNNELELSAIKLAIETIDHLSADIHDSFGWKLNELVSILAGSITNGKYSNVKVDEKMNIKVEGQDNYIALEKLSAGTIGQLYFALRLSISDLLYGKDAMPILLDDCFALYDDKRTHAALASLAQSKNGQIIIFSCHKREKAFLDQMQAGYHYVDLHI